MANFTKEEKLNYYKNRVNNPTLSEGQRSYARAFISDQRFMYTPGMSKKPIVDPWQTKKLRQENKEHWEEMRKFEQSELEKDDEFREKDLKHACPSCRMIRSFYEVTKGTCDGCGMGGGK